MKMIALLITGILSFATFADTTESRNLWFDGSMSSDTVNMSTEKTKTEYRNVQVRDTCYRTEYRRRCYQQPTRCRNICDDRGRNCRRRCSPGRRVCRNTPVQVPYSCMRTVRQAYEVLDYYVNTTFELNYDASEISEAQELFVATVSGSNGDLSVDDSGENLVLLKGEEKTARMEGETLYQTLTYDLSFVSAKKVKDALQGGVRDVHYKNGSVSFTLGKGFNTNEFIQKLKIYKARRLATDELLFDKRISQDQMDVTSTGSDVRVTIDLRELGVDLPSRMRVIMTTSYDLRGAKVLNPESVQTEASANWIFSK